MVFRGRAHKYGANVDTDAIIPACYLNTPDPQAWVPHCMENIDPEFTKKVQAGDVIVARTNFGCGSSREQAPSTIKASGISCVIASSFARIFFRNAINIGLPVLECDEAAQATEGGDELQVDLEKGKIANLTKGLAFQAKPYPDFMLKITEKGGLVNYARERLQAKHQD